MGNPRDITGQRFGNLIALHLAETKVTETKTPGRLRYRRFWLLRCDCGREITADVSNILGGKIVSCGCVKIERIGKLNRTHGLSQTPEYTVWKMMLTRCYDEKHKGYKNYGGRGITVCDRWRNDFTAFYADMGQRPFARYTLERRNNNGNYGPENCYWATLSQNLRNTRRTHLLTYKGETMSLKTWAERVHIPYFTLLCRIRAGWSPVEALTTPVLRRGARQLALFS